MMNTLGQGSGFRRSMARRGRTGLPLLLSLAAAVACGDGDKSPMGLDPSVFELAVVSGGGQSGMAGTILFDPIVVAVRNRNTGAAKEGAIVSWTVTQGTGQPTRSSSATDENGLASTRVALGTTAGNVSVEAGVTGLSPVSFQLTALPVPTIQSVSPTSADPGDTVEVRVNDLPAALTAEALFDGVAGTIVSRVDGAPAILRAVVPAPAGVCSATAQTVPVRVRVDGLTTASRDISVTVPADPFQVGQVLVIEGTNDVQCALLPTAGGTAKYLLVALSAELETDGQFQVTLGAGSVALGAAGPAPSVGQAGFHDALRAIERRLAAQGVPPARPPSGGRLFAGPTVGDTRDFWVLNDVAAANSGTLTESDFDRITATLKFVGVHTLLYLDDAAPQPGLGAADIELLGELYDRRLYDADVDFFGEPTDLDGNDGRVIILLSPVVNGLTGPNANGVIVGFFFGLDLFSPTAANCSECRFSNGGEILYGIVPDPDGTFSDPRTRQRVLELIPGVTVHETQHMINFRFKIFENSLLSLETLWLSEAEAHMAEELGGDEVSAAGDVAQANNLYASNFGRAVRYLQQPDSFSLTSVQGQGSLGERGAWWLFLRWIADQYGDFILRDLTQAAPNGVANVQAQTGESFFRLLADWAVALWADDQNIPGLAQRYQIPKWQLRSVLQTGNPPAYPLQPVQQTFATFRASSTSHFLAATSPFYVELDAAGDTVPLQLQLNATTAAGLAILRFE